MIAKISATENLGGAIGYNFKKVEYISMAMDKVIDFINE